MVAKKAHHFVPRMLLRNFANERNKLWWFRNASGLPCPQERLPESIFFQNHLHAEQLKSGEKDVSLEDEFEALENLIAPLFAKIIQRSEAGENLMLSDEERTLCAVYIYTQWKRTPQSFGQQLIQDQFLAYRDRAISRLRQKSDKFDDEIEDWLSDEVAQERVKQNIRVGIMRRMDPQVSDWLSKLSIGVGRISNAKKAFVITSNPVVKLTTRDSSTLGEPGVGFYLPISKRVVLFTSTFGDETHGMSIVNDRWIRNFNLALCGQSEEIAGHSKELVHSLTKVRGKKKCSEK
ncbi:DUF4238 domain-containing protein [Thalassospira sp.]|uniref:DUF4238 domain-containing protein n=1 Tax=Thalassospira sp. TaxID=1912094 RepID=UPI0032F050FB